MIALVLSPANTTISRLSSLSLKGERHTKTSRSSCMLSGRFIWNGNGCPDRQFDAIGWVSRYPLRLMASEWWRLEWKTFYAKRGTYWEIVSEIFTLGVGFPDTDSLSSYRFCVHEIWQADRWDRNPMGRRGQRLYRKWGWSRGGAMSEETLHWTYRAAHRGTRFPLSCGLKCVHGLLPKPTRVNIVLYCSESSLPGETEGAGSADVPESFWTFRATARQWSFRSVHRDCYGSKNGSFIKYCCVDNVYPWHLPLPPC